MEPTTWVSDAARQHRFDVCNGDADGLSLQRNRVALLRVLAAGVPVRYFDPLARGAAGIDRLPAHELGRFVEAFAAA